MSWGNEFSHLCDEIVKRKLAATDALLNIHSAKMVAEMKQNAKWTDRTAHARGGLSHSKMRFHQKGFAVRFGYGVEYGKWLEIACKKKENRGNKGLGPFAIVVPTIMKYQPMVIKDIKELWNAK